MLNLRFVLWTFSASLMIVGAGGAYGQAFPNKPIRIITAEVGAGSDFQARLIAQGITGPLGQPIIIENRPTNLAAAIGAKARADGYTLVHTGTQMWILPLMQNNVVSEKDFSPVTMTQVVALVLVVNPSVPVKSVKELIALAKAKPGELNYSTTVSGSAAHIAGELLKSMAGINIVRIGYKGNAPALLAAESNEVQMSFLSPGTVGPAMKSGKVRPLAVTSAKPSVLFPDLPPIAAAGLPGYESVNITGLFVPVNTPEPIIRKLNQEIVRVLNSAEVKNKILSTGVEPATSSPEEFSTAIQLDIARLGKVIKEAGIKAE